MRAARHSFFGMASLDHIRTRPELRATSETNQAKSARAIGRGTSVRWLLPGTASLAGFAYLLTWIGAENAGRTCATYGGAYILCTIAWLWLAKGTQPDCWDMIGPPCAWPGPQLSYGGQGQLRASVLQASSGGKTKSGRFESCRAFVLIFVGRQRGTGRRDEPTTCQAPKAFGGRACESTLQQGEASALIAEAKGTVSTGFRTAVLAHLPVPA